MDKRLVLAVAGSGKTTMIINRINEQDRALLITYTNNNQQQLINKLINKFGCLPKNIKVYTYFTFLYSFCFRPLNLLENVKGIDYKSEPITRTNKNNLNHYMNPGNMRMYHRRLAKYCQLGLLDEIIARIEKYFDYFYIDEAQDLAANDFNFMLALVNKLNKDVLMVGDFYQHTFDTSRDGNVNKSLYDNYNNYVSKFNGTGITVDNQTLVNCYRCTDTICKYVNDNLNINIKSSSSNHSIIIEANDDEIDTIVKDNSIIKLFYKESSKYMMNADNWGNVKGLTFDSDICIVLNKGTYSKFKNNQLNELAPDTKNKLYVALTRTTKSVYFIEEAKLDKYKRK